jgi:hypothetical protein
MKTLAMNQPVTTRRAPIEGAGAFALIELLVILVVVAMFAAVTLPALLTAREPVLRAQCSGNLRQVAVGWSIYQQQFDQVMPCHWPGYTSSGGTSNPWRTAEVYRVIPGSGSLLVYGGPYLEGPWNLGVLFATGLVPNPRVFYCPGTAGVARSYGYDYYASGTNGWPSTPAGSGDDKVRTGYNYYPQLRAIEPIGMPGIRGPKPAFTPTKWTALDAKKSIASDLVQSFPLLSHRSSHSVVGLNALFADGRVVFQDSRNNPEAFDLSLWDPDGDDTPGNVVYIGNSAPQFRYVMSLWRP